MFLIVCGVQIGEATAALGEQWVFLSNDWLGSGQSGLTFGWGGLYNQTSEFVWPQATANFSEGTTYLSCRLLGSEHYIPASQLQRAGCGVWGCSWSADVRTYQMYYLGVHITLFLTVTATACISHEGWFCLSAAICLLPINICVLSPCSFTELHITYSNWPFFVKLGISIILLEVTES